MTILTRNCYFIGCMDGQRMNEEGSIETCPNCRGKGEILYILIEAFTEGKSSTWNLFPYIRESLGGLNIQKSTRLVLQLEGPIAYEIIDLEQPSEHSTLCIDAGGRNFGTNQSVFVDRKALQTTIKELQDA